MTWTSFAVLAMFLLVAVVSFVVVVVLSVSDSNSRCDSCSGSKCPSISCGIYSGSISSLVHCGSFLPVIAVPLVRFLVVANILALVVVFTVAE